MISGVAPKWTSSLERTSKVDFERFGSGFCDSGLEACLGGF